ncbi:hypothetical protein SISSUDRAFT_519600 [Sistotremastrum suecicum HHB10207 ss-3]|uniref:DUF6535 domain-containing protein n=1 Tax=Sistotremastrum suecicum HHB10207 ss-3 TaxID=1314776 RepID=A0A165XZ06_9AGAM|nr:hypothetical protein SISSUDRAFT_519600 [Sistotremastrum suecicum HHB10207 ss-3]
MLDAERWAHRKAIKTCPGAHSHHPSFLSTIMSSPPAASVSPAAPAPPEMPSRAADSPPDPFDTPLFHRLLGLIEKQNNTIEEQNITMKEQKETMDEQKNTLKEHGTKLDALVRDAQKDDLPYDEEENPLENEQLWSGVYEIAAAKMKEEAEEWKGLMDVSLVFIAIFLAVLTAFLVPAAQALNPPPSSPPNNSTSPPPPLPPNSDQNVCAFYYLSLIMAMCNAVLCVLGRQWVGKLLSRPDGKTHRERTMRHEARKNLAYGWIKPLVAVLYWSLLLSIGLFIAGLLYQLRNLSTSFDQTAPILETTWGLGVLLAALIVGIITATTIHDYSTAWEAMGVDQAVESQCGLGVRPGSLQDLHGVDRGGQRSKVTGSCGPIILLLRMGLVWRRIDRVAGARL